MAVGTNILERHMTYSQVIGYPRVKQGSRGEFNGSNQKKKKTTTKTGEEGNSLITQLVKNSLAMQDTPLDPWVGRKDRLPNPVCLDFLCGSADKESICNAGDLGSILGLGKSPGERKGYLLLCSGLENFKDYIVHGVTKSRT